MSALERAFNLSFPYEVVLKYIKLYKMVGESEKDIDELSSHYSVFHDLTLKEDIKSIFELFFKNYKMTSARRDAIINKSGNTVYRNNDEIYLANLVRIFEMIYSSNDFYLTTNEIIDLESQLCQSINKPKGLKRPNKGEISYRDKLDNLISIYESNLKSGKTEIQYLNASFFIDFIKLSPFYDHNELIALIILYVLILRTDITCFAYISFFKEILSREEEYKKLLNISFYMYEEGMTNISELFKFFLDIEIKSYEELHMMRRENEQDKVLSKASSVETVIYKLPETFSKDDIRKRIPTISDSTIDRVLCSLQEQGKIMPIGRGRGAKWVRLDNSYEEKKLLFDNFD